MAERFERVAGSETLHARVTRALALRVIQAERVNQHIAFPSEAELCQQLGVSRSILREAVRVLADKGMVKVRPRAGMHSNPSCEWNLLDPDILAWRAQQSPDARLLRDLCEVRLAIEPTAAGQLCSSGCIPARVHSDLSPHCGRCDRASRQRRLEEPYDARSLPALG